MKGRWPWLTGQMMGLEAVVFMALQCAECPPPPAASDASSNPWPRRGDLISIAKLLETAPIRCGLLGQV
ncbi:hypothetical protein AAFF_G00025910 [Aldrovandia affinis]|uniref:Secreted protein n=1 Tax=Aldrovandia affinis TaxID=143900 RepID=A0AAD7WHC4_9TELE|nr:hypothetical protein AAFF_G00025910 [Aldrovandia affinis]